MTIGDYQRQTLAHVAYRQVGGVGHFPMLILPPPALGADGAFHLFLDPTDPAADDSNDGLAPSQSLRTLQALCDRISSYVAVNTDVDIVGEIANASYPEDVVFALPNPPKRRVILRGDVAGQTVVASGTTTAGAANSITDAARNFGSSVLVNTTGVLVTDVATTPDGVGTLAFTAVGTLLQWQAPGAAVPGAAVNVGAGGTFKLYGGSIAAGSLEATFIFVTVVAANLPVGNTSDAVTITNLAGLILHLFDPQNRAATERWQSIRNHSNTAITPVLAGTFGGGVVPAAGWTYEVLRPAARVTGNPAGLATAAPFEITMPWEANVTRKSEVVLAWLGIDNADAAAPGSLLAKGGLLRSVGCVYDGANGGLSIRKSTVDFGLDSAAAGDPVFGLVGANTRTLFAARALCLVTVASKSTCDLVQSILVNGFVSFGSRLCMTADINSQFDLANGGAFYRGVVEARQGTNIQTLLGSTGIGFLFKGQILAPPPPAQFVLTLLRECHFSGRGGSNVELQDVDIPFVSCFSHNSVSFDFAALVLTRFRSRLCAMTEGATAQTRPTFATTGASDLVPELSCGRLGAEIVLGTAIAGVTPVARDAALTPVAGSGGANTATAVLAFTAAGQTLTWTAPGDAAGAPVAVGAGGSFVLASATPGLTLTVHVKAEQLPAGNVSSAVTIADGGYRTSTLVGLGPATDPGPRTPLVGANDGSRIFRT